MQSAPGRWLLDAVADAGCDRAWHWLGQQADLGITAVLTNADVLVFTDEELRL